MVTDCWLFCIFSGSWISIMFLIHWSGAPTTVGSLLVVCADIWLLSRNSWLPSNWMIFFTLCWDVRGSKWSGRSDTSIEFLTLLLQLNWSGHASSFNYDTLKSAYRSCWFVLRSKPLPLAMACGTECILGSTVSDFNCISKLDFCATFLGYMGRFGVDVKVDLVQTLILTQSDSSLELFASLGSSAII